VLRFLVRRLLTLIPVLFLVSVVVFSLTYATPGDAATTLAGGDQATPARIEAVRQQLHLDDPLVEQYGRWLGHVVQGDLGHSLFSQRPITDDLKARFPVTLSLAIAALFVALLIGIPAGFLAGMRPKSLADRAVTVLSSTAIAIPSFVLAIFLVVLFAVKLKWLPAIGYTKLADSPTEWAKKLLLPAVSLGLALAASIARQMRGALADTMGTDHIRTAWAKGLPASRVVGKHAFKNAATPVITIIGLQLAYLLGGTIITEQIFSIPGIGLWMITGIQKRDLPIIQGGVVVLALIVLVVNMLVDLAYAAVNPRVRLS
jgi:peptide/nickel transport system permease protein